MKKTKIFLRICTILAIIFLIKFFFGMDKSPKEQNGLSSNSILVISEKLATKDFHEKFDIIGKIEAIRSKDYYAKYGGTVNYISNMQGKFVKKGEKIITIDEDLTVTTLEEAKTAHKIAKLNYERNKELFSSGVISSSILETSEVNLNNKVNLLNKAKNHYDNMFITAPFDGIIGTINKNIDDKLLINDYLFSIIDNESDFTTILKLPEYLFDKINYENKVFLLNEEEKIIAKGKITSISKYLNNNGTFEIKAYFKKNKNIIHNSFSKFRIIYNEHKAIGIPKSAISYNNDGSFIYLIKDKKQDGKQDGKQDAKNNKIAKEIYIESKIVNDEKYTSLIDNKKTYKIKIGDEIITEGLTKIYNGAKIKVE